jgi:putative ABC transport system permease protein
VAARVAAVAAASGLLDGAMPAVIDTVAVQDTDRASTEPRVTLFATDQDPTAVLGTVRASNGGTRSIAELPPREILVNREAAEALRAHPGDALMLLAGGDPVAFRVHDVVDYRGGGADGAGLLMGLSDAQALLGRPGQVSEVLLSNRGGETSGAARTAQVEAALAPELAPLGLALEPVKRDGLRQADAADAADAAMLQMFGTFGSISIFAGVMLIFLIFVLLAAERRGEMGVARAVGTQRGHLVQMFLAEGAAYDVVAAAIGALFGLAVAYVMVSVVAGLFTSRALDIVYAVRPGSLLLAYALGCC